MVKKKVRKAVKGREKVKPRKMTDRNTDIELVSETHDVYIISTAVNCNITTIKDNGNILGTLIALTDLKIEAQKSSDEALETLNQYFTAEEQNGANQEWQKVNA